MTDASQFDREMVVPTLAEFAAEFSCVRRAFLAVMVVDALAAQIYAQAVENNINPFKLLGWNEEGDPAKPDDSSFRHRIAENCTGFRIILDVAKANKHAILTRGKPLINRSDQIVSKPKRFGLGSYGEGRYGGVDQVVVQIEIGEEVYLDHQLLEAHDTLSNLVALLKQRLA
ncbi:hypothetical protein Q5Y75_11255 [Ruegeria sp. 2205SS24-7]|uniref:hypothetical protein n=1 Tax=Ruegeria discodermiae TaxID=3064389 RepID=UPI002742297D|nr:hypothetical protein [Ruegeria sp. 2205SS24-7]MDP5217798.1 hypothetical protein [Ruegeria sp. 2205SS24-7]